MEHKIKCVSHVQRQRNENNLRLQYLNDNVSLWNL